MLSSLSCCWSVFPSVLSPPWAPFMGSPYTSEVIVLEPPMSLNLIMSPRPTMPGAPWRQKGLFVRPGGEEVEPQLR